MSSGELRALRAEISALRLRVEDQEEKIAEQGERIQRLESGRSEVAESERAVEATELFERRSEAASFSALSSISVVSERLPVSKEDIEGRLQLARGCGAFLKRAIEGDFRGGSGRDRLRLPSEFYVVLADFNGTKVCPPKVIQNWAECRALCKAGGSCGKAVFLGFATKWEAKEALAAAGFAWPLAA